MKVNKAIILAAGYGTRRFPITKAVEKCMLPICNRPIIDYAVQDCIDAGITEIFFVVGEQSEQLQTYYGQNEQLNDYLRSHGKDRLLSDIQPPEGVTMHYIIQPATGKHGTAAAATLAIDRIPEGESAIVLAGDDFFYNADGSSEMARLIAATPEGDSAILGAVLDDSDTLTGRYGSIEEDETSNLIRITEHPEIVPDAFIKNVSKYLLNYAMLSSIRDYVENSKVTEETGGEYYIFAPFEEMIQQGETMKVVHAQGTYLDGGNLEGWLHANMVVAGLKA